MHQHPRSPEVSSPAPKLPSKPTAARDDSKERDSNPTSPSVDIKTNNLTRGLGIDAGSESAEQPREAAPGKEAMAKLNQIISVWTLRFVVFHEGHKTDCFLFFFCRIITRKRR